MITRITPHYGDSTCAAAVRAGDLLFLAHHAGALDDPTLEGQTRACLESLRATLQRAGGDMSSLVQVTMWVRDIGPEMRAAWEVFGEFCGDEPPARMTSTTAFFDARCLVQIDGVAFLGAR